MKSALRPLPQDSLHQLIKAGCKDIVVPQPFFQGSGVVDALATYNRGVEQMLQSREKRPSQASLKEVDRKPTTPSRPVSSSELDKPEQKNHEVINIPAGQPVVSHPRKQTRAEIANERKLARIAGRAQRRIDTAVRRSTKLLDKINDKKIGQMVYGCHNALSLIEGMPTNCATKSEIRLKKGNQTI